MDTSSTPTNPFDTIPASTYQQPVSTNDATTPAPSDAAGDNSSNGSADSSSAADAGDATAQAPAAPADVPVTTAQDQSAADAAVSTDTPVQDSPIVAEPDATAPGVPDSQTPPDEATPADEADAQVETDPTVTNPATQDEPDATTEAPVTVDTPVPAQPVPPSQPGASLTPLTADSTPADIQAYAEDQTWREFTGRADLSAEDLIKQMMDRSTSLALSLESEVEGMKAAAAAAAAAATEVAPAPAPFPDPAPVDQPVVTADTPAPSDAPTQPVPDSTPVATDTPVNSPADSGADVSAPVVAVDPVPAEPSISDVPAPTPDPVDQPVVPDAPAATDPPVDVAVTPPAPDAPVDAGTSDASDTPVTPDPTPAPVAPPVAPPVVPAPAPVTPPAPPSTTTPVADASGTVINVSQVPQIINVPQPIVIANNSLSGIPEVDQIVLDVPPAAKAIFARLMDYTRQMAPRRPVAKDVGVRQQRSLWLTVTALINREEDHFQPLFTGLLKFIDAHQGNGATVPGAFDDYHLYRFLEDIELDPDERKGFRFLLTGLRNLANPQTRATVLKSTDINKVFRYGVTDRGRAKLMNYFKL